MPTINQLVRKGRQVAITKSTTNWFVKVVRSLSQNRQHRL